ncbi:MAG: hypothetical protein MK089_11755, partial [Phycisphaerales bacterium]|nr:hypothetical protein [Phycisphaerales bacterium]
MHTTMKLAAACVLATTCISCGYKPAPKPPGYDSISESEADGVPPILSTEQLEQLQQPQLEARIGNLERTLRNTHANPGVSSVLQDQLDQARKRMSELK